MKTIKRSSLQEACYKTQDELMLYKTLLLIPVIFFLTAGCTNNKPTDKKGDDSNALVKKDPADSMVIKVYVEKEGRISADGNNITLADLDSAFSKLKKRNGVVYYSRDNSGDDMPAASVKVMDLVVKYSLPIRLYTDKTFTVIVKPE
jgi:biopolymer transport protein ExbD